MKIRPLSSSRPRAVVLLTAALLSLALLSLALLPGCLGNLYTLEQKTLTVGTYPGFEPFSFKRGDKIVGFDIDFARELARRLELEVEFLPLTWDWLIPGLFSEAYDVVISAMTITAERDKEIDFIGPYFLTNQVVTVREGSSIATAADLRGRTVGVLESSTALDTAKEITGIGKILEYDSYDANFEALESGKTDALIGDEYNCLYFSNARGGTRLGYVIKTDDGYGIGILDSESKLGRDIRRQLTLMNEDGTYWKIYEKWFGEPKTSPPQ